MASREHLLVLPDGQEVIGEDALHGIVGCLDGARAMQCNGLGETHGMFPETMADHVVGQNGVLVNDRPARPSHSGQVVVQLGSQCARTDQHDNRVLRLRIKAAMEFRGGPINGSYGS